MGKTNRSTNRKWRKERPAEHKRYGEKRDRDIKKEWGEWENYGY